MDMAKSLGQIHTVNYPNIRVDQGQNRLLFDLPGQLTTQLQHMCRTMAYYKVVGIDISIEDYSPSPGSGGDFGFADGNLNYYAPTKGRCEALKSAYHAVRRAMKLKGIDPSKNINYDFRPILTNPVNYVSTIAPVWPDPSPTSDGFKNIATLEIDPAGGVFPLCIHDPPAGASGVFQIWNAGLEPTMGGGAPNFNEGFNIFETSVNQDFVINEDEYLETLAGYAKERMESIPFAVAWGAKDGTPTSADSLWAETWSWKPDPALYLAVLCGQIECVVDNVMTDDTAQEVQLNFAFHVSGWKGILGSNKKRRSQRGKKRHGRKRRHTKR